MRSNRDNFTKEVTRILSERVNNLCSNPKCNCYTSGPNHETDKATRIGVAAHIEAAAPAGPRFNQHQTPEERSSIENGIWLCQNCSKLVDSDPKFYPIQTLLDWKETAENNARSMLEGKSNLEINSQEEEAGVECPWCGTAVKHGYKICLGCKAEVIYGTTNFERQESLKMGLIAGVLLGFILVVLLPQWLLKQFQLQVPSNWGLGIYSLIPIVVLGFFVAWSLTNYLNKKRELEPPRFFNSTIS